MAHGASSYKMVLLFFFFIKMNLFSLILLKKSIVCLEAFFALHQTIEIHRTSMKFNYLKIFCNPKLIKMKHWWKIDAYWKIISIVTETLSYAINQMLKKLFTAWKMVVLSVGTIQWGERWLEFILIKYFEPLSG